MFTQQQKVAGQLRPSEALETGAIIAEPKKKTTKKKKTIEEE